MARYAYAGRGDVAGGHDLRWSLQPKGRAGATRRNMDEPQQGGRADVVVSIEFGQKVSCRAVAPPMFRDAVRNRFLSAAVVSVTPQLLGDASKQGIGGRYLP